MNKKLTFRKSASIGLLALALSMLAFSAQALPLVTNGSFETTIGRSANSNYDYFPAPFIAGNPGMLRTSANIPLNFPTVTGWNITKDGIACVVFPNTYVNGVCGSGRFGGSGFRNGGPGLSPDQGNFVLVDGDKDLPNRVSTTLYQRLDGLIVGQFYDVFFYQASAQFLEARGDTTERWDVSLGGNPAVFGLDGNITGGVHLLSNEMITFSPEHTPVPGQGFHPWESQTLRFQVTGANLDGTTSPDGSAVNRVLGFFAVGTPGGLPPIVLLDGVSVTAVPEPETLALVGIGLLGILAARRQQKKRA